jgi:hypothetical protein
VADVDAALEELEGRMTGQPGLKTKIESCNAKHWRGRFEEERARADDLQRQIDEACMVTESASNLIGLRNGFVEGAYWKDRAEKAEAEVRRLNANADVRADVIAAAGRGLMLAEAKIKQLREAANSVVDYIKWADGLPYGTKMLPDEYVLGAGEPSLTLGALRALRAALQSPQTPDTQSNHSGGGGV